LIWKTTIESRHITATTLLTGLAPVHPGEILREDVLPALGKSKAEIARLLGTSRQSLYDLLAEKQGVTIPMALRLGKMCGNGGQFWFALQTAYDMRKAEVELAGELARIPTLPAA
jgi:antitoxin HigA-1